MVLRYGFHVERSVRDRTDNFLCNYAAVNRRRTGRAGYCNGVFGSGTERRSLSAAWSNASDANCVSSLAYSRSPLSRALRAKANSRAARSRNWSASDMGHPCTTLDANIPPYERLRSRGRRTLTPPLNHPAGRICRPWNVLQYLPRRAWQLRNVHRDKERLVAFRRKI